MAATIVCRVSAARLRKFMSLFRFVGQIRDVNAQAGCFLSMEKGRRWPHAEMSTCQRSSSHLPSPLVTWVFLASHLPSPLTSVSSLLPLFNFSSYQNSLVVFSLCRGGLLLSSTNRSLTHPRNCHHEQTSQKGISSPATLDMTTTP